jgi:Triosephosphate isomerase
MSDSKQDVLVFPATSSLNAHKGRVIVGAQNAYAAKNGAFTGEIGLDHLDEFNIKTILIGHSERRHILGETQTTIVEKFNFYKDLGFKIVYCVGEPLEKREAGNEKMMEYISSQYEGIDISYENVILAFVPFWAIGTGLTPTLEDIEEDRADVSVLEIYCSEFSDMAEMYDVLEVSTMVIYVDGDCMLLNATGVMMEQDIEEILDSKE